MKRWYRGWYHINTHLQLVHMELAASLHPLMFDLVDSEILEEVTARKHTRYLTQQKKLHYCLQVESASQKPDEKRPSPTQPDEKRPSLKQPDEKRPSPKQPKFHQRVCNLADSKLNKDEEKLLSKDLIFPNGP
jgi:hypothetical protein